MPNATPPPAGWYPDPSGAPADRWWNGLAWTSTTQASTAGQPAPVFPAPPAASAHRAAAPSATAAAYAPPPNVWQAQGAVSPYAPAPPGIVVPYGAANAYAAPWPARRPEVRGMGDAIRSVMTRYATFEGLASRSEFWNWYLFNVLLGIGVFVCLLIPVVGFVVYLAFIGWLLASIVPNLAVSVRRLRDAGYHWAFLFLQLVPFGGIVLIVLFCQPSKTP